MTFRLALGCDAEECSAVAAAARETDFIIFVRSLERTEGWVSLPDGNGGYLNYCAKHTPEGATVDIVHIHERQGGGPEA